MVNSNSHNKFKGNVFNEILMDAVTCYQDPFRNEGPILSDDGNAAGRQPK